MWFSGDKESDDQLARAIATAKSLIKSGGRRGPRFRPTTYRAGRRLASARPVLGPANSTLLIKPNRRRRPPTQLSARWSNDRRPESGDRRPTRAFEQKTQPLSGRDRLRIDAQSRRGRQSVVLRLPRQLVISAAHLQAQTDNRSSSRSNRDSHACDHRFGKSPSGSGSYAHENSRFPHRAPYIDRTVPQIPAAQLSERRPPHMQAHGESCSTIAFITDALGVGVTEVIE